MCLYVNIDDQALVAKADIVCWKYLNKNSKGVLTTPYRDFKVKIGSTYNSELVKLCGRVEEGLHSFVSFENAKDYTDHSYAKCIIPKGSKYFLGDFDGTNDSYASDTLKYVCEIDENGNEIIKPTLTDKVKKFFAKW